MKERPLLVVANTEAGSFRATTDSLQAGLRERSIPHEYHEVDKLEAVDELFKDLDLTSYGAVAAFGGDSTVIRVAHHLVDTTVPLLVIPGGSVNSFSKEVGTAASLGSLLDAYRSGEYVIRYLQVAACNREKMILDAHFGLFAETLEKTPRSLKNIFGEVAYVLTVLRQISQNQPRVRYELEVDGRPLRIDGHVCFIVNHGRPHIMGVSLAPSARAGMLRVAVVKRVGAWPVLRWWVGRRLWSHQDSRVVEAFRAERVVVKRAAEAYSLDDVPQVAEGELTFEVGSSVLRVVSPLLEPRTGRALLKLLRLNVIRGLDHMRRELTGTVSLRYSRVAPRLYLGGQYGEQSHHLLRGWRVGGIVSMREFKPKKLEGVEILHLPTVDHTAPALEDLEKGVAFIQRHLDEDESVYIHCRLGEGRGPTMAAAYLISTGMRPQDAIAHLQRTRPHARPNRVQVAQLMRFAERHILQ